MMPASTAAVADRSTSTKLIMTRGEVAPVSVGSVAVPLPASFSNVLLPLKQQVNRQQSQHPNSTYPVIAICSPIVALMLRSSAFDVTEHGPNPVGLMSNGKVVSSHVQWLGVKLRCSESVFNIRLLVQARVFGDFEK